MTSGRVGIYVKSEISKGCPKLSAQLLLFNCTLSDSVYSEMDSGNAAAGSSKKNTVYVAGFPDEVKEQQLLDAFVTFGESVCHLLCLDRLTYDRGYNRSQSANRTKRA